MFVSFSSSYQHVPPLKIEHNMWNTYSLCLSTKPIMTLNPSPCLLFQRESFFFCLLKSIQWVGHNLIFGPLEKCFFQSFACFKIVIFCLLPFFVLINLTWSLSTLLIFLKELAFSYIDFTLLFCFIFHLFLLYSFFISFLLLILHLICSSFYSLLRWEANVIHLRPSFSNIDA